MPEIVDIKGVGPVLAKACIEQGYGSVEKIAGAKVVEFVIVPGVSEVRAKLLIEAAKLLLNGAAPVSVSEVAVELDSKPAKKDGSKKKKSKKKDKSKRKTSKKKKNKKNDKKKSKKKK